VVLNNDIYVTNGWLAGLLAHFRANPKLGPLGPITNRAGNESVVYVGEYSDMRQMAVLARRYTQAHRRQVTEMGSLNFFCVMIPRSVWEEVGELDEAFGIGLFEDDDYSMRVRSAGYEIGCAEDVFVHHHLAASIGTLSREVHCEMFEQNRRYFESKWGAWVPPVFRKEVREMVESGTLFL
jgi:GT2 family glycosyltransferase